MNYADMSVREINLRLHTLLECPNDVKFLNVRGNYAFWSSPDGEICAKHDPTKVKNYCGDISVLWPLMIEHKIAVIPLPDYPGKFSADRVIGVKDIYADNYKCTSDVSYQDYDPLKAVCFVLLMILGDK